MKRLFLILALSMSGTAALASTPGTLCDRDVSKVALALGKQNDTLQIFDIKVSAAENSHLAFEVYLVNDGSFSKRSRVDVLTRMFPAHRCQIVDIKFYKIQ